MKPATKDAHRLFLQGSEAFADIECNGMPINVAKLRDNEQRVAEQIVRLKAELRDSDVYKAQRNKYGKDTNVTSRDQLAYVLFGVLGFPGLKSRKTDKWVLDEAALKRINHPYCAKFLELSKLEKLQSTYIQGLLKETVNGRVHGFFQLHNVSTYRGSADTPNLNNLPVRNKVVSEYIKDCVEPHDPDWVIVEQDYSALEVHVACCYHKDPTMIDYLEHDYDMHSDMAQECYKLDQAFRETQPGPFKAIRQETKALFTFAEFYGDYYVSVANNLWNAGINKLNLQNHLASKGITRSGVVYDPVEDKLVAMPGPDSMVSHIEAVERRFWKERFKVYDAWKETHYAQYCHDGYFHTLTGFRWWGVEKRNFIINAPVQGSAFHCLLQSLIVINKKIKRLKMRARIIAEIHDSLVAEVHKDDLADYVAMANDVMTTQLQKFWPWIIVRLKTETEVGKTWHQKKTYTP